MPTEVLMPALDAGMDEGTLVRWLKKPGDPVERGEPIAEIETEKAIVDLESFDEGVFARAVVDEGTKVPVNTVLAYLVKQGESMEPPAAASDGTHLRASPLARKLAMEMGVDLTRVQGSGPDGRIVKRDVEAAAGRRSADLTVAPVPAGIGEAASPHPVAGGEADRGGQGEGAGALRPLTRMRQAIARRMAYSKREAPHYYITVDVDMTDAMTLRRDLNAAAGADMHMTVNDLLVKAAALAIAKAPAFNASFSDAGLVFHDQINICLAVAMPEGLIAPAVMDCGGKSLVEVSRAARDVSERARTGHLLPSEMSDGTFTISNLGAYGVETVIAIIQPPQAAIIGAGMVQSQPVVRDGQIVVREMLKLALSADHRVTDGAQGAQFMQQIRETLEQPLRLVL